MHKEPEETGTGQVPVSGGKLSRAKGVWESGFGAGTCILQKIEQGKRSRGIRTGTVACVLQKSE